MGNKNREYVATIYFNENNKDMEEILQWLEEEADAWIVGEEIGEKEEHLHLQGLVQFVNPRSFRSVSKELNNCHLEKIHKSSCVQKAYDYCKKGQYEDSEDYIRFVNKFGREPECWTGGEFNLKDHQGKRNDLELIHSLVEEGENMREIISQASNYQGIRTGEKLLEYFEPARDFKPDVLWFWGTTGTGKSKTARETAQLMYPDDVYECNANGKWWNGYDGHKAVIIDDFRYDWKSFSDMLKMLDRYGYRVETKGGMRQLLAKIIIITCPYTPRRAYKYNTAEDINQLNRRITEIRQFGTEVVEQKSGGNTKTPDTDSDYESETDSNF